LQCQDLTDLLLPTRASQRHDEAPCHAGRQSCVTSGIDVALRIVADLEGETVTHKIQLAIEYHPHPPFPGGTPSTPPAEIVEAVLAASRARRLEREGMVAEAVERLRQLRPVRG
jgi:hypothetical protein